MADGVTKSLVLPRELADAVVSLAASAERSFSGEVRRVLRDHVAASVAQVSETSSGFSKDDATRHGFVIVRQGDGYFVFSFGETMTWSLGSSASAALYVLVLCSS